MKPIVIEKDNSNANSLYEQLYSDIKQQILSGDISAGEKIPSVRSLAAQASISVTTVLSAYNQLVSEGYLSVKPGSGYFAESVEFKTDYEKVNVHEKYEADLFFSVDKDQYVYDEETFDFIKWKKCASRVFNEYSYALLSNSSLKGEPALRQEISHYLLRSRGVHANPENIIISAGTQQLIFHLGRILKLAGISLVSLEKPGYSPVRSMFADAGFSILDIPVTGSGIDISKLPGNLPSATYVNPSNQFPTGDIMPIANRQAILNWAAANRSYIIEDDYDSELRYFGKPLPTLKSLDENEQVIYLSSFSSTLFPAIKISYMVLPSHLTTLFDEHRHNYAQTCSKAEQLTLALFMNEGHYYTAIKKKRSLYTAKLNLVMDLFEKKASKNISPADTQSGLSIIIKINSSIPAEQFVEAAGEIGIRISYIKEISKNNLQCLSLYYNSIPLSQTEDLIGKLIDNWNKLCE